jgi:hypothetical protein
MTAWRRAIELSIGEDDLAQLVSITRSRTEPASRVERARMLLAYREDPSFFAVGQALGLHHQTVQRCVERALAHGPMAALDDRPRPGKEPTITAEAKAWLVSLACRKARELGYPHEVWTTRLLARHARKHGPAEGHACLGKLVQGTVCKILNEREVKPHKVRYYLERRDPEFKDKMAEVLCIYSEVKILKETAAASKKKPSDAVAVVSYDEKPGIQAIATTAPDLPPEPGVHATFTRDHEYKRHGTPKIRDEIFEDAATLGGMGFSAHFGQRDGGWFPVTQFRGRFFAVRAGIFESFRHRYAGGGSSFGFPRARQAPAITTALEWHPLPA